MCFSKVEKSCRVGRDEIVLPTGFFTEKRGLIRVTPVQ